MRAYILAVVSCCAGMVACETTEPDPGYCPDCGADAGDGAIRDGDAQIDTGTDAGPCGGACSGTTPLCDETRGECVECLMDGDCSEPSAARCDVAMGRCAPCERDEDCARLAATPVCEEASGACVACTEDTEDARCGGFACRASDGTCSAVMRTRDTCDACTTDLECLRGRRCVMHVFDPPPAGDPVNVGTFCFLDASMGGCGDTDMTRRPFRTRVDATSIDGVAGTYCFPPITTTCRGIRDTQSVACSMGEMCGEPSLDDGYCPTGGSGAGACTYLCAGAFECTFPLECAGTPAHCRPP